MNAKVSLKITDKIYMIRCRPAVKDMKLIHWQEISTKFSAMSRIIKTQIAGKEVMMNIKNLSGLILAFVLFLWITPCSGVNITYYDANGDIITKEKYEVLLQMRRKALIELQLIAQHSKAEAADIELHNRLESFLAIFSQTFENEDLDKFSEFFAADAEENGKPFVSLLPKYRHNFEMIDSTRYQIDLQKCELQNGTGIIKICGNFHINWLKKDAKRQEMSASFSMNLIEQADTFVVKRFDYRRTG